MVVKNYFDFKITRDSYFTLFTRIKKDENVLCFVVWQFDKNKKFFMTVPKNITHLCMKHSKYPENQYFFMSRKSYSKIEKK
jgi:hypothetical protein